MDKWVKQWLSEPRLHRYLSAARGDDELCMELYAWNNELAAALLRDLADVEVLVRNKFNNAIVGRRPGRHWLLDPQSPVRVEKRHKARTGDWVDANAGIRARIERAIQDAGGVRASPGQVVAQLTFGFWLSLVRRGREHEIWTPYVVHAFKARHERQDVESHMSALNDLRNRVAHHEHLLTTDVPKRHVCLLDFCRWLSPKVAEHISARSCVEEVVAQRPC